MNIKDYMLNIGKEAKKASFHTASATSSQKDKFLNDLAKRILKNIDGIVKANKKDLIQAVKNNFDDAFIDRLTLNKKNISAMADGLLQIEKLNDPIGEISNTRIMESGIKVSQMRVSLGVIGMIYESRPNVTIDAAGLSIKSGNAIILRGGSEAINSNMYLGELITQSLNETNLHSSSVQIVEMTDRDAVNELITMNNCVDVIIPRGGKSLIKKIIDYAKIPVIKHLDGNCHIYVDNFADLNQAIEIVDNSKTQRLGTCNTLESLVVSSKIAKEFLPKIKKVFDNQIVETLPRKEIWRAQTPQIFYKLPLLEALQFAKSKNICGTDEASLLERIGYVIIGLFFIVAFTKAVLRHREETGSFYEVDVHKSIDKDLDLYCDSKD